MFQSVKERLSEFFKRFFSGAGPEPCTDPGRAEVEQRGFDRYPVGFPVMISGNSADSEPFEENSRLRDISGSGAMFITQHPARYYRGQFLRLCILLDASEDVRARITNDAYVVRIHRQQDPVFSCSPGQTGIAVNFSHTFDFQRIDSGRGGCSE
ncbi:MAG: PilZ domain-containing protein [Desulfosalsimonas sp.]